MLGYGFLKIKLKKLFLIVVTFSICFYFIQVLLTRFNGSKHYSVLLWWTPFMAENERIINCYNKYTCLLTKDRSYYNSSNAYLFYGSSFNSSDLPLPKKKTWAIIHEESPRNSAIFLYNETWELFEITSTFSRYSDFPVTLQYLHNLSSITSTKYSINVEEKNELLDTIAPVLYIQSDCDTPVDRDSYVKELMNHIAVDSYGGCLNNRKFPKEIAEIHPLDLYNEKLLKFTAKYKFVLAFENAICDDYITEKLWRPLMAGSVPIYMGSPSVLDWLPNKRSSAIITNDFESPKNLADFIKKVNNNDELYKQFLGHKFGRINNDVLIETLAKGSFGLETYESHLISAFECFVCKQVIEGVVGKKLQSVYNCARPQAGNSWNYHWKIGECQVKALRKFVETAGQYTDDKC